jgi:orotate phosphoribosyltransferase-like protein
MAKEYAVYKGDELLAMGTAEECATELNVTKEYIVWLTMPTAKRRLAKRKHPEKCTVGFLLDDDEE